MPATEDQPEQNAGGGEKAGVCAPRVTIDADGNIVLDEERLVFGLRFASCSSYCIHLVVNRFTLLETGDAT